MTVQESLGLGSPTIATITECSRTLGRINNELHKFPIQGNNADMLRLALEHAFQNITVVQFMLSNNYKDKTGRAFENVNKPIKAPFRPPGDMKPSSIEDGLTHEEPHHAAPTTAPGSSIRENLKDRYAKASPQKLDSDIDQEMMHTRINQTREMYTFIHYLYKIAPRYIEDYKGASITRAALQESFQSLKIIYHILIRARDEFAGPASAPPPYKPSMKVTTTPMERLIVPFMKNSMLLPWCD